MTAKAIVDLEPGALRSQLLANLRSAGVDCVDAGQPSDDAFAQFRAAGAERPAHATPTEVHLWTGRRLERRVNPFERGDVRHVVGSGRELDARTIHTLVEHLEGQQWIGVDRLVGPGAAAEQYVATRSDEKPKL